eukprot:TRINITY_DN2954_c0_g6_i1.p1 TRINITY_DN2954_c0_g6~~TRINITY_DN2954_c0_g6_i1.p1  ORF type:complete len:281 (+),score=-37.92 TRINITY_DN2954_c0_g6_i1:164-1006(+)
MKRLKSTFLRSEKLQRHVKFLYAKGGIYTTYNSNLLFHGCIPMNKDGSYMEFEINGKTYSGKSLLEYADVVSRAGYYAQPKTKEKQFGKDFLWFLWCGRNSPVFGRNKMATFERALIDDATTWVEDKNAYYTYYNDEDACIDILKMFGLNKEHSHIINGHMPVKTKDGEKPIKANGKLIVIDGGFCKAYQSTTGIAGYTLIYNSHGMRLCEHKPFSGSKDAIQSNKDIYSTSAIFETAKDTIRVAETDIGKRLKSKIEDLRMLLKAYKEGAIKETIDDIE